MSNEHRIYLRKLKHKKILINISRLLIGIFFIMSWEILTNKNIINPFIYSSPSQVLHTLKQLIDSNNLFIHIWTTSIEVLISILLSTIISLTLSITLYSFKNLKLILDPYITLINSLPKVALSPYIIIILGANIKSIIVTSLLISVFTTTSNILNGFYNVSEDKIKLFKILECNRLKILTKLIIPSSKKDIISALKINLSLSLIGIITGEFLSSKKGIGYLILYGTQVFNLSLVATGIILLILISYLFYLLINLFDNKKYH